MKKVLISLAIIATAGVALNKNAFGGCATNLVSQLQACFATANLTTINMTYSPGNGGGGTSGIITVTGSMTQLNSTAGKACIYNYKIGQATCPAAPILMIVPVATNRPGPPSTN